MEKLQPVCTVKVGTDGHVTGFGCAVDTDRPLRPGDGVFLNGPADRPSQRMQNAAGPVLVVGAAEPVRPIPPQPSGLMLVVPDGKEGHVRLYDMSTGLDVLQTLGASSLRLDVDGQNEPKLTIELNLMQCTADFDRAHWLARNPVTERMQRLASMTFADGTIVHLPDSGVPVIKTRGSGA